MFYNIAVFTPFAHTSLHDNPSHTVGSAEMFVLGVSVTPSFDHLDFSNDEAEQKERDAKVTLIRLKFLVSDESRW